MAIQFMHHLWASPAYLVSFGNSFNILNNPKENYEAQTKLISWIVRKKY